MVHRALGFALSLLVVVATTPSVVAQIADVPLPAPLTDSVSDYARVLDATAEARIVRLLEETLADTGVEVRVVTMPDIAVYGGAGLRLEAYAKALLTAWDLDDPDRTDSVLVLVATGPREARIALGDGYEPAYEERAARILSSAILPDLRKGQVAAAIEAGIFLIRDRLIVPFKSGQPPGTDDGFNPDPDNARTLLGFAGLGGIAGLGMFVFFRSRRMRKTCPQCGSTTLGRSYEVIEPATSRSSGTGLEHRLCTSCGFTDRRTHTIRRPGLGLRGQDTNRGGTSDSMETGALAGPVSAARRGGRHGSAFFGGIKGAKDG
ncbi:MAG: TPM domain-containing protein [Rhodobacterales bacterium]|nr:TPM domain-containing protein [Rhodobacterales bacterium]